MILTITPNPTIDRVYFVGEFEMGKIHRPEKVVCSAGGKGLNVARVSHILNEDVLAMGFAGGFNGEYIKAEIEKLGIKTAFTPIDGETRICVNISDSQGKSGELLEKGPQITQTEQEAFFNEFTGQLSKYDIICISGSLPPGLDESFYAKVIRLCKEKGKRIIADASEKVLGKIIDEKPFMIKPNRYELSVLMEKEISSRNDVKEALLFMKNKGIELPLITLGKDGAMAYIGEKFYKFNSPCVTVKNAVGSGDSSVAGIAVGLSRGMDIIDAIRLGMASGTANTQFEETGFVSCELVEKYYKEITVETIV